MAMVAGACLCPPGLEAAVERALEAGEAPEQLVERLARCFEAAGQMVVASRLQTFREDMMRQPPCWRRRSH
jgi:hypothetical protein